MATGVIQLDRRLDRHTARDALAAFEQALAESQGQGSIVLDLAQVEDFDSAGMGAVVQGLKEARAQGIEVKLARCVAVGALRAQVHAGPTGK